jgi:hypothetical protein
MVSNASGIHYTDGWGSSFFHFGSRMLATLVAGGKVILRIGMVSIMANTEGSREGQNEGRSFCYIW